MNLRELREDAVGSTWGHGRMSCSLEREGRPPPLARAAARTVARSAGCRRPNPSPCLFRLFVMVLLKFAVFPSWKLSLPPLDRPSTKQNLENDGFGY